MAGSCSLVELRLKEALENYQKSKALAEKLAEPGLTSLACFNIASLYIQLGDAPSAYRYAEYGLARSAASHSKDQPRVTAGLKLQKAKSLGTMGRFPEALGLYYESSKDFEELQDFQSASLAWHLAGSDAMDSGKLLLAEQLLERALYLARMHNLQEGGSILRKLARLRGLQGNVGAAGLLYDAALSSPPDTTPRWLVYADRGEFRLAQNDFDGAFSDFRTALDLVRTLRADVVPNDQGRINLENGLSRIADGFIEAGNHLGSPLSKGTAHEARISETFNAAEQDRSASLAALTPLPQDWRSRLPPRYWDVLNRYRSVERSAASGKGNAAAAQAQAEALQTELSQMEAAAGSDRKTEESAPLRHVRDVLHPDDVFLSFHIGKRESWLWIVNSDQMKVVSLPPREQVESAVRQFRKSVQGGASSTAFEQQGRDLYSMLFGKIPPFALRAKRWMIEPEGPLFDLPWAALVVSGKTEPDGLPVFLGESVALQLAPGALLLRTGHSLAGGTFVGVGDPIYNAADPRYKGKSRHPALALPRLPASQRELLACSREYAPGRSTLLTGPDSNAAKLVQTLQHAPTILHFATHVIPSGNEYKSGLIALGLNPKGDMEVLGPTEIIARKVEAELVVLNGCHSGQAQTIPGSGLMGLTRAWLGAGANAVLATQWDVPDDGSQALMVEFYKALREHGSENPALALQRARHTLLKEEGMRENPALWAAYFLLART